MLKIIAAVVVLGIAGLLIAAALRPPTFRVERSILVNAPPEAVLAQVSDFKAWRGWSPYETLDADLQRTYGGAERGVGATYAWAGKKAGTGRMRIDEAASRQVRIALDFEKPFKASNTALFTAVPEGDVTRVTWSMSGPAPFISRLMGLVFNMDKMIGRDFETGLFNLKTVVERS
ncbi:polyketide cyclase [Caulobacter sp. D4A]|uniref:SRPBCC family protein n=1 Tax=unclassified Caulobacter TaxID=2648921 RepID=UPI000D728875|nr:MULTISPECIES: SRPBCC family protein [unclassified Caulobacter]PXA84120.1 polyketide cyclase [Caulobacter sp. D4A]PXA89975.1 polyketide cyclase [Caulobacter sp. D5]